MADFPRSLDETITLEDFLFGNVPGSGLTSSSIANLSDAVSDSKIQSIESQDAIGLADINIPFSLQYFEQNSQDIDIGANLFDPIGAQSTENIGLSVSTSLDDQALRHYHSDHFDFDSENWQDSTTDGTISIIDREKVFTPTATGGFGDLGHILKYPIFAVPGTQFFLDFNISSLAAQTNVYIGVSKSGTLSDASTQWGLLFQDSGDIFSWESGDASSLAIDSWAANTLYTIRIDIKENGLAEVFIKGGSFTDFTQIAIDSLSRNDGLANSFLFPFIVVDGIATTSGTLTIDNFKVFQPGEAADSYDWANNIDDPAFWTNVIPTTQIITVASEEKTFSNAQSMWNFGNVVAFKRSIQFGNVYEIDFEFDDVSGVTNVLFSVTEAIVPGVTGHGIVIESGGGIRFFPGANGFLAGASVAAGIRYRLKFEVQSNFTIDVYLSGGAFGEGTRLGNTSDGFGAPIVMNFNTGGSFNVAVHSINSSAGSLTIDNYSFFPGHNIDTVSEIIGYNRQVSEDAGQLNEGIQGYLWSLKNILRLEKDTFDTLIEDFSVDYGQSDLFFKSGLWTDFTVNGSTTLFSSVFTDLDWGAPTNWNETTTEGTITIVSGEKVYDHTGASSWDSHGSVLNTGLLTLREGHEVYLKVRRSVLSGDEFVGITPSSTLDITQKVGFRFSTSSIKGAQSGTPGNFREDLDTSNSDAISSKTILAGSDILLKWVILSDGRVDLFADTLDGAGLQYYGRSTLLQTGSVIGWQYFQININNTGGSGNTFIIDDFITVEHTKHFTKTVSAWNETGHILIDKADAAEGQEFEVEVSAKELAHASINLQHLNQINFETGWGFLFSSNGDLNATFDGNIFAGSGTGDNFDAFKYKAGERYRLKWIITDLGDIEFYIKGGNKFTRYTKFAASSDRDVITNNDDLRVSFTLFTSGANFYFHDYQNNYINSTFLHFERPHENIFSPDLTIEDCSPICVGHTGINIDSGETVIDLTGPVGQTVGGFDNFSSITRKPILATPGTVIEIEWLLPALFDSGALLFIAPNKEFNVLAPNSRDMFGFDPSLGGTMGLIDGAVETGSSVTYQANLFYTFRFYFLEDGTVRLTVFGNEHTSEKVIGISNLLNTGNWLDKSVYVHLQFADTQLVHRYRNFSILTKNQTPSYKEFQHVSTGFSNHGHSSQAITAATDNLYEVRLGFPTAQSRTFNNLDLLKLSTTASFPGGPTSGAAIWRVTDGLISAIDNGVSLGAPISVDWAGFHTFGILTRSDGGADYYINGNLERSGPAAAVNLESGTIYAHVDIDYIAQGADSSFDKRALFDYFRIEDSLNIEIFRDDFFSDSAFWTDTTSGGFVQVLNEEPMWSSTEIQGTVEDIDFLKKHFDDFPLDTDWNELGSIRTWAAQAIPEMVMRIDFFQQNSGQTGSKFIVAGLQDGGDTTLDINDTIGAFFQDLNVVEGIEKNISSVSGDFNWEEDTRYTIRIYFESDGTASITLQGGEHLNEVDLGTTTLLTSGDYKGDFIRAVMNIAGARSRPDFAAFDSYELVRSQQNVSEALMDSVQTLDNLRLAKNKVCIDMDNFNNDLSKWDVDETDGTIDINSGLLRITRDAATSFDDLGLIRTSSFEGRVGLIWEVDIKLDSTNSQVLWGVTDLSALSAADEVGIFFDDDGNVKIRDHGSLIGSLAYSADVWYRIVLEENGTGALEARIQGGAYVSPTVIGTSTTNNFDDDLTQFKTIFNVAKLDANDGTDYVYFENYELCRPFGNVSRSLTEDIPLVNNRVGQSKGVFLRSDLSSFYPSNDEIRLLDTTPDTGEIAVSKRFSTGSLRTMRFVPGTDTSTPNSINLGSVPSDPGSQGWVLDNSPQGVLLRGDWEARVLVRDSTTSGQIKLHARLYTVKTSGPSVEEVLEVGPVKSTITFTPNLSPTEHVFFWSAQEVGEKFVGIGDFIYLELFVQEISKPTTDSNSVLRLDNLAGTLFSRLRFPGVTLEPTFERSVGPETAVTTADSVEIVKGAVRNLVEIQEFSDTVVSREDYQRDLSETIPPIVDTVEFKINTIFESIGPVNATLDRLVNNIRDLQENIPITDQILATSSTTRPLVETIKAVDQLSAYITRPDDPEILDGVNKRPYDKIARQKRRNLNLIRRFRNGKIGPKARK